MAADNVRLYGASGAGHALVPVRAKMPLADEQQEDNDGDSDRLDHSQGNHLQVVRHGVTNPLPRRNR